MGVRYLRQVETTQMILRNHTSNNLAFFNNPKQLQNRTLYYKVLCKLFFAEENVGEAEFFDFMKPFDDRIEQLGPVNTDDDFRQENVKVREKKPRDLPWRHLF